MNVTQRLLDETNQLPAILQLDFDMGLVFRNRTVRNRRDPFAHTLDGWIVDGLIGVLLQSRLAAHQANGGTMVDRVLPFKPARNLLLVAEIDNQRRYAHANLLDGVRRGMVVAIQVDTTVDRGMHHESARIRLVGVVADLKVGAETIRNFRKVILGRLDCSKASRALNAPLTG